MKPTILLTLAAAGTLSAGEYMDSPTLEPAPSPQTNSDAFATIRRPVTNPTLFDLALPRTQIHPIYMHHQFPSQLNLANGAQVPFDGDLNLFALQFEYALSERLSIVAMKDGYVDFNPGSDSPFTEDEGFANIGGGLKYAFLYDPANEFVASVSAMFEFPWGSDEVFQGDGDGNVNLSLQAVKLLGPWQFAGGAGVQIPVDDDFSTQAWFSGHVSYYTCQWFIPFIEANLFTILDEGNGSSHFNSQVGGAVPAVAPSEGADLLNWGAASSETYATLGVGFRTELSKNLSVGFAYEFPLTDEEDNITEDRFTVDAVITF